MIQYRKNGSKVVVFRVDSGTEIGTGHVMRCLVLATALRAEGDTCLFICRGHGNNMIRVITEKGFTVHELAAGSEPLTPADFGVSPEVDAKQTKQIIEDLGATPEWLVVDHYGIDKTWEQQLRPVVKQILVIDDLANRPHDCDVLLDSTYTQRWDRYEGLVPQHCCQLLGPEYALLSPEFIIARKQGDRPFDPRKVLIFFGGIDPQNYTTQALQILREIGDFAPEVVIGAANPHRADVEGQMRYFPEGQLHIQTDQMAEIMLRSSWYLGAGGSITWQRMCLGLTGIVIPTAQNQVQSSSILSQDNFQISLQKIQDLITINQDFCSLFDQIKKMRHMCKLIVDGDGVFKVCLKMTYKHESKRHPIKIRRVCEKDNLALFLWANDPVVRYHSWNSAFIPIENHLKWFNQKIKSKQSKMYIAEYNNLRAGQVRYDYKDGIWVLSYSLSAAFRGLKLSTEIIKICDEILKNELKNSVIIRAEVKKTNPASIKCLTKAGYQEIDDYNFGQNIVVLEKNLK